MEALVTGGTGSVGRQLVRSLAARGDRVRVLTRSGPRDSIAPFVATWCDGNLLDPPSLRRAADGAEVVFHLAARVDFHLDDPAGMRRVNVEGTQNVLEASRQARVRRVVHVSTIGAVGAPLSPHPVDETFGWNLAPLRIPYFDTKREAEERVREAARDGLDAVIVNPSITAAPPDRARPLRGLLARLAAGHGLPLSLRSGVNIVDRRDAAETIAEAACRGLSGERYLVTGENVSVDALMALVADATGGRVPRFHAPQMLLEGGAALAEAAARALGRTPRITRGLAMLARHFWYYDASKAARELAHAPRPLAQTVEDLARALRAR